MAMSTHPIIDKIVSAEDPYTISGFLHTSGSKGQSGLVRIYPNLDAGRYVEVPRSSIIAVEEGDGEKRSTFVIGNVAEATLVDRTRFSSDGGASGFTAWRAKLPPEVDRLTLYKLLPVKSGLLKAYLGTESIPGTGQTGNPEDDL